MKVRIGVAAGAGVIDDPVGYLRLVDALDDLGFDSIWVPDVVTGAVFDPIAALGVATGRRPRLKIGSHLIVPGRDPVWLAKQLATLDQLSQGRLLLLAVIGLNQPEEVSAQGVEAGERTTILEASLDVMRTLWAGGTVRDGVRLAVRPVQQPLEVWLGGQVPAALRRCGRIGDGWMPGLCTPEEAGAARERIQTEAEAAGRTIDVEHFGMNLSWLPDQTSAEARAAVWAGVEARRPGFDPAHTIGVGPAGLAERINAFCEVGISKFVIRPATNPDSWADAVEAVAPVLSLQT